jgi:cytochrome b561
MRGGGESTSTFSASYHRCSAPDKVLAKQAMAAHEFFAYLLLALIALHIAAALFHHFVRRDNVLNAMLPGRRR